jgi:hypothetical protein
VLDKIEENKRLVFRIGGSDFSPVIVHEKIKRVIEKTWMVLIFSLLRTIDLAMNISCLIKDLFDYVG